VKRIFEVALGILAAIGGFVDIGDIVFNTAAGATFGYELLWAVLLGAIGIMVFSEMSGRVALVAGRPVLEEVRQRKGFGFGLATLIASQLTNLLTCAAEIGGVAIVLQLLLGLPYRGLVLAAVLGLVVVVKILPFNWIERIFGFGGLMLIAFSVAAFKLHPDWGEVGNGFVPSIDTHSTLIWGYFVVGLVSATLMPYEVYFYSSGVIEDGWKPPTDIHMNRITAVLGFGLGAFLSFSLIIVSAEFFLPHGIDPEFLGTVALAAQSPLGQIGLLVGLGGILLAISGAAIDTALSGAYNLSQFFGWEWGKYRRAKEAPVFTLGWIVFFLLGGVIILTGIDPVKLTEYSVIFGVVVMPLTYLPILLLASDETYMGKYVSGRFSAGLGWLYFGIIVILALTAMPLMVLTNMGQG